MKITSFRHKFLLTITSIITFLPNISFPCTGIELKAKDGTFVNGRTVEFGIPLQLAGLLIPRHYEFKGTLPDGSTGLVYHAKYAVVGGNTYGAPAIVDGLNEKGLSAAAFYFPNFATYTTINAQNKNKALSPAEFVNWVLTQFATVNAVKQGLNSIVIAPTKPQGWGIVPPFHYVVYDKIGNSIVIEPINGKLKVFDNPLGIITNSPSFKWHITNLANYTNLSPINSQPINIDSVNIQQFGQGQGLHGLPGDFTSPSRFIRAAIFTSTALPSPNAAQTVLQVFHVLNQFDIPLGAVRNPQQHGNTINDYTVATTVKNPQDLKYYFKTYDDQAIKMVDLHKFNWNSKQLGTFDMAGKQKIDEVSPQ